MKTIVLKLDTALYQALSARREMTGTATAEFVRRCIRSGLRAEVARPPKTTGYFGDSAPLDLSLVVGNGLSALEGEDQ